MREVVVLLVHLIATVVRVARPGGLRAVVAESVLVRHQLLILNRGHKRAPNLRVSDRIIAGLCALLMRPARVLRSAIVLKPSTLLHARPPDKTPTSLDASGGCSLPPTPQAPSGAAILTLITCPASRTR